MLLLGKASVGLLEVLAGSFVAAFQLRRRLMSTLEEVYAAQRDRLRTDVVSFSPELHDELLSAVSLLAVAQTDFRLRPSDRLVASDASTNSEAAVYASVPPHLTEELQRHALQGGMWNKLLSPCDAYLREKGLLDPEAELPDGHFDMHPLWEEIVTTQKFQKQEEPKKVTQRRHINLGEIRAALRAEHVEGMRYPDSFYIHLQDSQVSLASLVKGRSSSKQLNLEIRGLFAITHRLQCETPSTGMSVRRRILRMIPLGDKHFVNLFVQLWFQELWNGKFEKFDAMLQQHGLERMQLSGLPDEETLVPLPHCDLQRGKLARVEKRKKLAKHGRDHLWPEDVKGDNARRRMGQRAQAGTSALVGCRAHEKSCETAGSSSRFVKTEAETTTEAEKISEDGVRHGTISFAEAESFAEDGVREGTVSFAEAESFSEDGVKNDTARDAEAEDVAEDSVKYGTLRGAPAETFSREKTGPEGRSGEKEASNGPGLSAEAIALLKMLPRSQFVLSKGLRNLDEAFATGPGFLDLFSGSRGLAKAITSTATTWVLTYDISHDLSEDLLSFPVQRHVLKMIRAFCFRAMSAGPVCSSFSTAVTPPVRSREHPAGVPWCSEKQRMKNMLAFVIRAAICCLQVGIHFLVENPDGSWMWRQTDRKLDWSVLLGSGKVGDFRTDFCRYGTAWRKRTRFRTTCSISGHRVFCECKKRHVQLRGRCAAKGCNYTKLAEPYPRSLCRILALALAFWGKFDH